MSAFERLAAAFTVESLLALRLPRRPRPVAVFESHSPDQVVHWPVERRICRLCRQVRRVDVRDDGTLRCELGHVSGRGA